MSLYFEESVNHGVRVRYSQTSLSRLSIEDLRNVIQELNNLSDRLGCVVFEGDGTSDVDLIIFAGNLERYSMLSIARSTGSRVFYFQDTKSWWYGGSELLPDVMGIASFLREHVTFRKCLAFGQSSGGYAALALGGLIPHCDVLACSPQTFADGEIKRRIAVSSTLSVQSTPDYLIDIAELYRGAPRTGIASAVFSASEFQNPYQSHFWMDHLHLSNLTRIREIDIHIAASANHSIVLRRAQLFSDCLRELLDPKTSKPASKRSAVLKMVTEILEIEAVGA